VVSVASLGWGFLCLDLLGLVPLRENGWKLWFRWGFVLWALGVRGPGGVCAGGGGGRAAGQAPCVAAGGSVGCVVQASVRGARFLEIVFGLVCVFMRIG